MPSNWYMHSYAKIGCLSSIVWEGFESALLVSWRLQGIGNSEWVQKIKKPNPCVKTVCVFVLRVDKGLLPVPQESAGGSTVDIRSMALSKMHGKTLLVTVTFLRSWQERVNKGNLQMNDGRAFPYPQSHPLDTVSERGRADGSQAQTRTGGPRHPIWGAEKGGTDDRDPHTGKNEEDGLKMGWGWSRRQRQSRGDLCRVSSRYNRACVMRIRSGSCFALS